MKLMLNAKVEATSFQEVIERVGLNMEKAGFVKDTYVQAVLDREKDLPTGLKIGKINVAIPHTDIQHVNETVVGIATLKEPVKFHLMEDPSQEVEVDIVFLLGVTQPKEQTKLLGSLMSIFKDKERLVKLKEATTEHEIHDIFQLVTQ